MDALHKVQDTICDAVKLSYPKSGPFICVFIDASERFWSGSVSQTEPEELDLNLEEQQHKPLAFIGAQFKGAQVGWSTFEKEGFAIFETFHKLDYLFLGGNDIHVHTNGRNLIFVFAPLAIEPTLG